MSILWAFAFIAIGPRSTYKDRNSHTDKSKNLDDAIKHEKSHRELKE